MANPFPFVSGAVLTAANLNGIGEYVAFTPTWTNLTVGNGTQTFRYGRVQDLIHVQGVITLGSTSSIAGNVSLNAPINSTQQGHLTIVGAAWLEDSGTANYMGIVIYQNTNILTIQIQNVAGTYPTNAALSSTVPFTWGTSDALRINCVYEV